ncbi:MAG: response regulator [Bacteroidia bacterium]|nr:response regulator [Bacteroidia bacterium]
MKTTTDIKIFLVNSNLFYLNIYEQSFKKLGYNNVTIFLNGTDCINELVQKPDIIFMDDTLIDMSGSELLKQVKSLNPNIYVVLGIDPVEIKTAVNTLNYGVFDYIIKGEDEMAKAEGILLRISKLRDIIKRKSLIFSF